MIKMNCSHLIVIIGKDKRFWSGEARWKERPMDNDGDGSTSY